MDLEQLTSDPGSADRPTGAIHAQAYRAEIAALIARLGSAEISAAIKDAARVVSASLESGGKVWLTETTHSLHTEATLRAGGLVAVHILHDAALANPGDAVIVGSPVGTNKLTIDIVMAAQVRGAAVIALTNVAFENDACTVLEHPSRQTLSALADIVVDIGGPVGDGVFEFGEPAFRVLPHSGVIAMTAMWMIFADCVALMHERGLAPLFYECILVEGARARNEATIDQYLNSGVGYERGR